MNPTASLLTDFGFTPRDAIKIARRARENDLTLAHVQAWIHEAQQSTSLYNPRGFVRARIEDGDKTLCRPKGPGHHSLTHTCTCGRIVYASHICLDCDRCPTCCTCEPDPPLKE